MQTPPQLSLPELLDNVVIHGFHGRPVSPDYVAHWFGKRYDTPTNAVVISRLAVLDEARLSSMREDLLTRLKQLGIPASAIATEEWRLISATDVEKAVGVLCHRIRRDEIQVVAVRDLNRFGRASNFTGATQVLDALATVNGLLVTADTVFMPAVGSVEQRETLDRLAAEQQRRNVSRWIKQGRALAALRRANKT